MDNLKAILKTHRKGANLSQQEIAEKIKVTQPYYSSIENGRFIPSLKVFSRLATVLDIDMNVLKQNSFDD